MAERLILCSGCGAKNRIPPDKVGQPRCGGCGKQLAVPGYMAAGTSTAAVFAALTFLVILVLGIYSALVESPDKRKKVAAVSPPTQTSYKQAEPTTPIFTALPVPVSVGVLQKPTSAALAPLAVKTRPGKNYYIKLVDADGRPVMTMYVKGGQYFETLAPLGTFEMRYAAGDTWYGPVELFGPDTSYSKANSEFRFTFDGYQYSGYTVELILQTHGNLKTSRISHADF